MDLDKVEGGIKALARRYSNASHDVFDLEQIGRITVWKVMEKNEGRPLPYLIQAAKYAIIDELRKSMAQKRGGGIQRISFYRDNEDSFAPEDFTFEPSDITRREKTDFIKSTLRKKFGRTYLEKMKKSKSALPPQIIRGLVEVVWGLELEDIPDAIDYKLFVDTNMSNFLWAFYRNSPMRAIQDAYPGRFFEWEFKRVPNNFWDGAEGYDRAVEATRWLCQKHNYTGDGKCTVGYDEFTDEGFGRMLELHFNHNPNLALNSVFPGLKPWQTKQTSSKFLDEFSNQKDATGYVLQTLGFSSFSSLSPEDIYDENPRRIRKRHFVDAGLSGLMARHGKSSYELLTKMYLGKIHPWFITGCKNAWKENPEKTAAEAIRWLFDEYLQVPKGEIPAYATQKLFWNVGYSGILTRRDLGLNTSSYRAIDLAYPGEFSRDDFDQKRKTKSVIGLKDFRGEYNRK